MLIPLRARRFAERNAEASHGTTSLLNDSDSDDEFQLGNPNHQPASDDDDDDGDESDGGAPQAVRVDKLGNIIDEDEQERLDQEEVERELVRGLEGVHVDR